MSTDRVTNRPIDCTTHVVDAALLLARSFAAGNRLVVSAPSCPDHAHHVAVEFIHPVVAGARPVPALVVDHPHVAREPDCLLVIGEASGEPGGRSADLKIPIDSSDAEIMLAYHLLWELVQVCLEHPGIVGSVAGEGSDSTGFLYPFLDASESDETALRASLDSSATMKRDESAALVGGAVRDNRASLATAAAAISDAVVAGGRVVTMGNGGSSTDAARIVRLLTAIRIDAMSLSTDYAVFSALANDLGAEHVFARQVEALVRPGDVMIGCSTSGTSRNLLAAFEQAAQVGAVGIGLSGYGGGAFAHQVGVDHCLAVESSSVHRIQEAQAGVIDALCAAVESASVAA